MYTIYNYLKTLLSHWDYILPILYYIDINDQLNTNQDFMIFSKCQTEKLLIQINK